MKIALALLAFFVVAGAYTFGQGTKQSAPCGNAQSQAEMNICWGKEYKTADAILNQVYRQLVGKLDDQDAKLAAFQTRYVGALPDDEKTTLTLLSGMTPQLDAVTQSLNQARQAKAFLESMLSQQLGASKVSPEGQDPETPEQQLSNLQKQLLSLQGHDTDEHPDVVKLKRGIAEAEKKIQDASAAPQRQPNEQKTRAPMVVESPQIQQLRAQLHESEVAIQLKTAEQEGFQRQIKVLQSRVQSSPMIQQEFKALTRDYQTALNFYNELLKNRNESQMATELENRQQGEHFRVLDPPSLPERPSWLQPCGEPWRRPEPWPRRPCGAQPCGPRPSWALQPSPCHCFATVPSETVAVPAAFRKDSMAFRQDALRL